MGAAGRQGCHVRKAGWMGYSKRRQRKGFGVARDEEEFVISSEMRLCILCQIDQSRMGFQVHSRDKLERRFGGRFEAGPRILDHVSQF